MIYKTMKKTLEGKEEGSTVSDLIAPMTARGRSS